MAKPKVDLDKRKSSMIGDDVIWRRAKEGASSKYRYMAMIFGATYHDPKHYQVFVLPIKVERHLLPLTYEMLLTLLKY